MRSPELPIVTTTHGDVRGVTEEDITVWRGIPYAAPPVGERRSRLNPGARRATPPLFPPPAGRTRSFAANWRAAIRAGSAKIAFISTSGRRSCAINRCR